MPSFHSGLFSRECEIFVGEKKENRNDGKINRKRVYDHMFMIRRTESESEKKLNHHRMAGGHQEWQKRVSDSIKCIKTSKMIYNAFSAMC